MTNNQEGNAFPQWTWSPEEKFEISGQTLQNFLNLKNEVLNSPETPKIVLALALNEELNKVVQKSIEDGKIVDVNRIPTELNHYSALLRHDSVKKDLGDITGLEYIKGDWKGTTVEHTITNQGEKIWINGYWIPKAELDLYQELKEQGAKVFRFGYITGRQHYLGDVASGGMTSASMHSGYILWIEYQ